MMPPSEAPDFARCVMRCYDLKEFRQNWERLRKASLSHPVKSQQQKAMKLFIDDVRDIVWDRLLSRKVSTIKKGGLTP